jgi:hypothetical protein
MDKLSKIHLSIPEYQTDTFADLFEAQELHLPNIRTLVLGSYNDFLIKHCPGVEIVSSSWHFLHSRRGRYNERGEWRLFAEHTQRLLDTASKLENLTYFEMTDWWSERALQGKLTELTRIPG